MIDFPASAFNMEYNRREAALRPQTMRCQYPLLSGEQSKERGFVL